MDQSMTKFILKERGIAYAITDLNLNIIKIDGAVDVFSSKGLEACTGCLLFELVPELVGNEDILDDILVGHRARFQLFLVNRRTLADEVIYLTMLTLPYRDQAQQITGLIHLVEDVTQIGKHTQDLTQQRNELRL